MNYEILVIIGLIVFVVLGFAITARAKHSNELPADEKTALRKLMIDYPNVIDDIFLSQKHRDILLHVFSNSKTGTTAVDLAEDVRLTIGSARCRLKHLFDKDYLTRKKSISPKSGAEYIYFPIDY